MAAVSLSLWGAAQVQAAEMKLTIKSDFPGGNVVVERNEGSTVHVSPDLRTSPSWFYWYFEAEASEPGHAVFAFKGSRIGARGPAVSVDDGKTWKWMGLEHVTFVKPKKEDPEGTSADTFSYDFTAAQPKVRFSVGFPYVQSNLDEFLKKNGANPNLAQSVLATTRGGRPVELLQIGKPAPGVISMVVAARSHCCEALASYVLEGFLHEAMSDSFAGVEFRKKYVLYAVPMLDKDGVQAGDQGKNRKPHDHNRDYGVSPNLYPEIKALQDLGVAKQVRVAIDFHCPALKGDIHGAFHWLGLKVPHISNNADELSAWQGQERPGDTNAPFNFLATPPNPPKTEGIPFSWYFASLDNPLLAITLESPYAQVTDIDEARAYGSGLLRALVETEMVTAEPGSARKSGGFAAFGEFQKKLGRLVGQPEKAGEMANAILNDPASSPVYKAQANLGMAAVRQRQKKFAEAAAYADAARAEAGATHAQKANALVALLSAQTRNPDATPAEIEKVLAEFEAFPYPAASQQFAFYGDLSNYYEAQGDYPKALAFAQKRLGFAAARERSGAMLRIAATFDLAGKKEEAVAMRKEVVALLRPQLLPVPKGRSIFLGVMAGEMLDALNGIPTATLEEKVEAAKVILNYPTLPSGLKQKTEEWMKENGAKGGV